MDIFPTTYQNQMSFFLVLHSFLQSYKELKALVTCCHSPHSLLLSTKPFWSETASGSWGYGRNCNYKCTNRIKDMLCPRTAAQTFRLLPHLSYPWHLYYLLAQFCSAACNEQLLPPPKELDILHVSRHSPHTSKPHLVKHSSQKQKVQVCFNATSFHMLIIHSFHNKGWTVTHYSVR